MLLTHQLINQSINHSINQSFNQTKHLSLNHQERDNKSICKSGVDNNVNMYVIRLDSVMREASNSETADTVANLSQAIV